jgi:hypothetical protein
MDPILQSGKDLIKFIDEASPGELDSLLASIGFGAQLNQKFGMIDGIYSEPSTPMLFGGMNANTYHLEVQAQAMGPFAFDISPLFYQPTLQKFMWFGAGVKTLPVAGNTEKMPLAA